MKVFLVATEESGDRLGAALMQALKARLGPSVEFRGVGGYEMAAEGLPSLFRIDDLAIVGIAGITQALPKILSRIRQTARAALDEKPDVMVIIDSPDFTHRVARRVRKKNRNIPIVDYVSPSVWAWRPGRARAMRRYIDHVLALLPFEPEVHRKLGGPPCTYVGHPLVEQIDELRPNAEEAVRRQAGHAAPAGTAGQPQERNPPPDRAVRAHDRANRKDGMAARYRDPDHAASAGHGPARDRALAAAAENRGEARGSARGVSQCPGCARQVRHRDAGTWAIGRADDHRLQGLRAGGGDCAPADPGAVRDPDESRARRQCGAGIHPDRLHAGTAFGGAGAAVFRHARSGERRSRRSRGSTS